MSIEARRADLPPRRCRDPDGRSAEDSFGDLDVEARRQMEAAEGAPPPVGFAEALKPCLADLHRHEACIGVMPEGRGPGRRAGRPGEAVGGGAPLTRAFHRIGAAASSIPPWRSTPLPA